MASNPVAGCRVLVVEDELIPALVLVRMLEHADAIVVGPVVSVREALDRLDPLPDFATLDINLGTETSFPVADELARQGVPFIFVTGSAHVIPPAHLARPVCAKPCTSSAMLKAFAETRSHH